MGITPEQFSRRSFIHARLVAAGAELEAISDTAVAARYPHTTTPPLGLADLSPLPRTGLKGPHALAWMREHDWPVPAANNLASTCETGERVLRLSDREAWVLGAWGDAGQAVRHLETQIPGAGIWHVPRRDSHAWFLLEGDSATACLAKLCGVDLRPQVFACGQVAQTVVARMNAVVCRDPTDTICRFHLLADSASAIWFWDTLLDAMEEFGGGPIGVRELA